MNFDVLSPIKYAGTIVEYLDQARLRAALVTREQERHLAVIDSAGHERLVPRDLVLMRHPDRRADREDVAEVLADLERERAELAAELESPVAVGGRPGAGPQLIRRGTCRVRSSAGDRMPQPP